MKAANDNKTLETGQYSTKPKILLLLNHQIQVESDISIIFEFTVLQGNLWNSNIMLSVITENKLFLTPSREDKQAVK